MVKKSEVYISIILATWNRAHLLAETLESISVQTNQDWECIIIDDGSKDDTERVANSFTSLDSRFTYHPRTEKYNKGLPGSRNQGLDLAKGDFIIFFDDDDIVHPKNLQTCFDLLRDNKFSFCRYDKKPFFENTKKVEFEDIQTFVTKPFIIDDLDKMVTGEIPFASCCVMWDKKCFERERFNEELMYAEEWECYSRILSKGFEGVSLNQVLYFNRKHPNSNTGEFQNNSSIRIESKIKAALLVVENLISKKNYLSPTLKKFFIRLGFTLKSHEIIQKTLNASGASQMELMKYRLGFIFYPFLRPLFILKGKLKGV